MKRRWLIVALVVALALLLFASCSLTTIRSTDQNLRGRMLLWHALNPGEAEAFYQIINSFTELHPNVSVKVQPFSTTVELNDQFINAVNSGLGPDLILAPSAWLQPLMDAQLVAPVDQHLTEAVISRFNPSVLAMLQSSGQTYGLPQSLDTMGLYVNRLLVDTPVNSLAGVVEQANAGTTVLMPINFTDAVWGIQAFGGQLFDEEGRAILDQGGFANWLAWLREARNAPGMIQDTNRDVLRQRFISGEAGYYFGYASELNEILNALGADNVTVLPLPGGPVGPAGPFVNSQAFFFSRVSSSNQHLLAAELAKFITNVEQSSRLMRLVRHVPANINVRINPRLYPLVAAFTSQARNGIPLPTRPEFQAVVRLGNEAYVRALEGGESPAEVAFAINNSINEANGFEVQAQPAYACRGLGNIILAHSWYRPNEVSVLEQIIANFGELCPLIIVQAEAVAADELLQHFDETSERSVRPAFALANQRQLQALVARQEQLKNLGNLVNSETLQRFTPTSIEAMRHQGVLYGWPFALQVDALYYNRQLAPIPAQTLDELRAQATSGVPITLDVRFERAFWGLRAFGGQLFAPDGAAILDQGGFADWLLWLRDSRDSYGIRLSDESDEILRRFLAGESAYYVAGPDELAALQEALGENLGIALLPSGPAGPAEPLVRAEGFVLREGVTGAAQSLALEFMNFATNVESQTLLMQQANKVPANANVSAADAPYMGIFIAQAQAGFLAQNHAMWQPLLELGDAAYAAVLEEGADPAATVAELTAAINRANNIVVTPTSMPEPTVPELTGTPAPAEEVTPAETPSAEDGEAGTITDTVEGAGENEESDDNGSENATPSPR